jgi:hypothetical protein
MGFTKLNAPMDTERDAVEGQGSNNVGLSPRRLQTEKVSTPDMISRYNNQNNSMYMQVTSPVDINLSRVLAELEISNKVWSRLSIKQLNSFLNFL